MTGTWGSIESFTNIDGLVMATIRHLNTILNTINGFIYAFLLC